jgi:outer membrane lipoprotein carrier protein
VVSARTHDAFRAECSGARDRASKEVEGFSDPAYIPTVKIPSAVAGLIALALACTLLPIRISALPNVHVVAEAVDQHYNRLRTLEADFTEIYQGGGLQRTESGTLRLKKPGKMRWDYRSLEEKLFVSNGTDTWLYLPEQKQVRKSSLKSLEDVRSPLAFLLGKTKLEKELPGLSFAPDVQVWQAGDSVLRGVPRGMEGRVEQVLVEVNREHQIVRILIQAADDSITEYRFSNQRENVELADKQFQFSPPPGTETVNEASEGRD